LWRPELSFTEKRSALLRRLEEAALLSEFKLGVDDVTVRIGPFESIKVGVGGAICDVGSPTADVARVRIALEMTLDMLAPSDVVLHLLSIRCFEELDGNPAAIQVGSGGKLIAVAMPSAVPLDWALLLDGRARGAPGQFKVEFGVVSGPEAAMRLSLPTIGRTGVSESGDVPFQPDTGGLPACALFFDWHWFASLPAVDRAYVEIVAGWDAILSETQKLSEEVKTGLVPQAEEAHG
jgi:hypothetical protein